MTPTVKLALVFLLLSSTTALFAQERHLGNDSVSTLYSQSPFAHGYIHGYEEGFHFGDLDLQLGRNPRDPASIDAYKHPSGYLRDAGGSKPSCKVGYQVGFRAGYIDAMHQLPFRAITSLRQAAQGLGKQVQGSSHHFDSGFRDGYDQGKHHGGEDARAGAASNPINPPCLGLAAEYCAGFNRGFLIGYSDAYVNLLPHPPAASLQASAK